MAINMCRAERQTGAGAGSTQDSVAPGTYNVNTDSIKVAGEKPVPFASGVEKVCCPNNTTSRYTPGPGTYVGPNSSVNEASGLGATNFKSKSARIAPTAPGSTVYTESSICKNPGPGTYEGTRGEWEVALRKPPRNAANPWQEAPEKTVPSIPLQKLPPGAQAQNSMGADVSNVTMRHTGERKDTVGPGDYDPKHLLTTRTQQGTSISLGSARPKAGSSDKDKGLSSRSAPGPGAYDMKGGLGESENPDAPTSTSQFASKTALSYQKEHADGKGAPGPGAYDPKGHIDKLASRATAISNTRGLQTQFGSSVQRTGWARSVDAPFVDPYNLHHVPGPGSYPTTDVIFSSVDKQKEKEASKAVPGNKKKQFYGVHHPMIVMALQETQGPLEAFGSTDDRACNKDLLQTTPSPWAYNRDEARGNSMAADLREKKKVGRSGAFGTLADRFFGSPMQGRDDMPEPGMPDGHEGGQPSGANSEPRSMFTSATPRMQAPPGTEVHFIRVGHVETPAPGDYVTEKQPNYRSPFRHPRSDHLSFGTGQTRFDIGRDIFDGISNAFSNPAPGEYEAVLPRRSGCGAAEAKEKRKMAAPAGSTTTDVGPGSYGSIETGMLKKTFNVSTQLPAHVTATSKRRPRPEAIGHSM